MPDLTTIRVNLYAFDRAVGAGWNDVSKISADFPLSGSLIADITDENDVDFAKRLTKTFKIASIPLSVFNENNRDDKVLRFCFAKTDDTLVKAAEILCKI